MFVFFFYLAKDFYMTGVLMSALISGAQKTHKIKKNNLKSK